MKKSIIISLVLLSLFLLFCKEETPVESIEELYTFSGKVFSNVDSQKVYLKNIRVILEDDSTITDAEGFFSFDEIPEGKYSVTFLYSSQTDSIYSKTVEIDVTDQDLFVEYAFYDLDLYKVSGNVCLQVANQKVYLGDVTIVLEGDTVLTDAEGFFSFYVILSGKYSLKFLYSTSTSTLQTKTVDVEIVDEDYYEEFILYEIELVTDDIIYVTDDNYYFRSKNGDTQQITYTNDRIEDEVSFFHDGNRFVYISVAGENNYSINIISLNPMNHKVIYEVDEQIQDLRISEDETKICFLQNDKIMRLDINSRQTELLYNMPPLTFYSVRVLFHDCRRYAYSYTSRDQHGFFNYFRIIKNFITGDSSKIWVPENGVGRLEISFNDAVLFDRIYDDLGSGKLWNLKTDQLKLDKLDGKGMGKFSDDAKYFYGIQDNLVRGDNKIWTTVINLSTHKRFTIEPNLDFRRDFPEAFNTLSYSEKENIFLYSLFGDIKIYNANIKRNYDFMVTDADEHGARFVNVK